MKVTVVFCRVVTKPEYNNGAWRWLDAYLDNGSGYEHQVVVINRYGDSPDTMFDKVGARYMRYDGGGWDCGAWQFAGQNIDTDLLVCFNSSCVIMGDGWLERFVEAVEAHGEGLYGPLTSYEIVPHVRTPCMIFQPSVINDYPMTVETREDTYRFESMGWPNLVPNFTQWTRHKGKKTMLVTWDGVYDYDQWRDPPDIFRRGNQSNCIVKDRHCEAYEASDEKGKKFLESLANWKR